jgi:hypothetical protein
MPKTPALLWLWTFGSRAVCSIANGCILVASRGGETRQCKNDNRAKDDYESAQDVIGTRAVNFSNLEFLRIQDPDAAPAI